MENWEFALDVCIFIFFSVSTYFGLRGLKEIDESLKEIDAGISAISFFIGLIILLKQFG